MSVRSISAHAAKLEWDYVREWGFPKEGAKDRWAVTRLIRLGEFDADLANVALEFAALTERTAERAASPYAERVSTGRGDPHYAALRRAEAVSRIAKARAHIQANCRADHARVFELAFAHPHPTVMDIRRETGLDHRGVARALRAALTRLWGHWQ